MSPRAQAPLLERTRGEPVWAWRLVAFGGLLALAPAPAIALFLLARALGVTASEGGASSLLGLDWLPAEQLFGLTPLVFGTLSSSLLALALALPIGLGCAIHISFFAGPRVARLAAAVLGVLGGMPSVVIGLFGTLWLVPLWGPSLGTAALVLAAMITPTFALLAGAAFDELPPSLVTEGLALGVPRGGVVRSLVLPAARRALLAAASLSLGRALGEALAVEMVCGNVAGFPTSLSDPVRTLTTTLVQEFEYAEGPHAAALSAVALCVVVLAALASAAALRLWDERAQRPPGSARRALGTRSAS